MKELIIKSLDKIRPMLQRDGGDVELVDVSSNGIVSVKMNINYIYFRGIRYS